MRGLGPFSFPHRTLRARSQWPRRADFARNTTATAGAQPGKLGKRRNGAPSHGLRSSRHLNSLTLAALAAGTHDALMGQISTLARAQLRSDMRRASPLHPPHQKTKH